MPFSPDSDGFHSDADGTYNVSFFASSVKHSMSVSQRVFGLFAGGGGFSRHAEKWRRAADEDRRAFLLEHHEAAHHGLLFSTPAGVLLWRVDQVISRDIRYISTTLNQLGIPAPHNRCPENWLRSSEFTELLARNPAKPEHKSYLLKVIKAVQLLRKFRALLFESDKLEYFADFTVGDCLDLFRFVYPYLAERCDLSWQGKWVTRLRKDTKLFPPERFFNIMDIAEAHAMAKELFILRAMGDRQGFEARAGRAVAGQFGAAFKVAMKIGRKDDDYGFSPHLVQMAALMALSTRIDLAGNAGELVIEEELPWWRFSEGIPASDLVRSAETLQAVAARPLIGAGSKWLMFYPIDFGNLETLLPTLASFALDLQINLFHRAAARNLLYLAKGVAARDASVQQREFDDWSEFLFLNQAFVEYTDGLFCRWVDLSTIYKDDHPLRDLQGFDRLEEPLFQLLAHIVNGLCVKRALAVYGKKHVATADIVTAKLIAFVSEHYADRREMDALQRYVATVIDGVFGKKRDLPFGAGHLWENPANSNFV
jgi:hypothetical protein